MTNPLSGRNKSFESEKVRKCESENYLNKKISETERRKEREEE